HTTDNQHTTGNDVTPPTTQTSEQPQELEMTNTSSMAANGLLLLCTPAVAAPAGVATAVTPAGAAAIYSGHHHHQI
ncbi:hypothetical protein Dimus_022665, partial [Dionaea muscipula]